MVFNNAVIIGAEFKDFHPSQHSRFLFAEVVLLNSAAPELQSCVYQLKKDQSPDDEDIQGLKQGILALQGDPFIMLGAIKSIERSNKHIILENGNIVVYKYLIMAGGPKREGAPFLESLQTLLYALLVSKKIPDILDIVGKKTLNEATQSITHHSSFTQTLSPDAIEAIAKQTFSESDLQSQNNLMDIVKNFCQVQL